MHPVYEPDLQKKDKYGFCLMNKFPHLIGDVPVDKGLLKYFYIGSNIHSLAQYTTLSGIRKFHCFKFTGSHERAQACESPEIIYDEDSNYSWKDVKIPAVKTLLPSKRKSI